MITRNEAISAAVRQRLLPVASLCRPTARIAGLAPDSDARCAEAVHAQAVRPTMGWHRVQGRADRVHAGAPPGLQTRVCVADRAGLLRRLPEAFQGASLSRAALRHDRRIRAVSVVPTRHCERFPAAVVGGATGLHERVIAPEHRFNAHSGADGTVMDTGASGRHRGPIAF
ncbi:hypothetical protein [Uliginosibacterium sp. H1]|uniref:hypothetical protein n=1 Tax=Uliginosibacterium sp. H1 TaxID=3114757 RepID=UPI002E19B078|nr:hypothetical protein [Uliginosibacterium sp. H1]